ncbi:MAG TPA: C-terminal binding protein [Conexibacter sp.]|nr:C-terminal binding protein [Conexibacter sp.]
MSAPLVVVTDADLGDDAALLAPLHAAGLEVRREHCASAADVIAVAAEADALIVQWAPIDAVVLARLPRLRFVSRLGIGYDMIDVAAATARGVAVANMPDYCVEEVAAHTLALLLATTRRLPQLDRAVRAGSWSAIGDGPGAIRPSQTTVAILGHGRIGSLVAAHAAALGFRVLVHDPHAPAAAIAAAGHQPVGFEQALQEADVLSLHVPLTAATHHLIDAAALARMRPGGVVVNTCRGGLVDEAALAAALADGHLAQAALDVFEQEPLPPGSPLRALPNLLLTPHSAWYSPAALAELPRRAAEQVADFLAGRPVPTIVNPGAPRAGERTR